MNGGNIDTPLIGLCKEKTVTVLIDGDRGGELNVKKLAALTKVDFVAKAPDGKEVEELVQKEILQALKRRVPMSEAFKEGITNFESQTQRTFEPRSFEARPFAPRGFDSRPPRREFDSRGPPRREFNSRPSFGGERRGRFGDRPRFDSRGPSGGFRERGFNPSFSNGGGYTPSFTPREEPVPKEVLDMKKDFDKLKGKSKARILDEKGKKIKEVEVKDLLETIQKTKKKIGTVMFDGIITNRLVEAAEAKDVKVIVGVKKGAINPQKAKAYTM